MTAIGPPSLRFALRGIRRTIGYHRLVVVLIALPVLAGVWMAVGMRTVQSGSVLVGTPGQPGGMDAVLLVDPLAPDDVASLVDAIEARGAKAWAVRSVYVASLEATVVAGDWTGPYRPDIHRVDGVMPAARGQVALSTNLARHRGLGVGDIFREPGGSPAEVVGIVTTRSSWSAARVYVGPHGVTDLPVDPGRWGVGFDSGGGNSIGVVGLDTFEAVATAERLGLGADSVSAADPGRQVWHNGPVSPETRPEQLGALVTAALLVLAVLLAAAAFAVSTSRRLTEVGRLQAIGLTPDQVRRTILAEAALVGAAGAVLGAVLAVVAAAVARDALLSAALVIADGVRVDRLVVGVADVMLPVVLAVGGAMAAAWVPARRAAGARSVAALAGRQAPPVPVGRRWMTATLGALAAGWLLVWLLHPAAPGSPYAYGSDGSWFVYENSGGTLVRSSQWLGRLNEVLAVVAGLLFLVGVVGLAVAGLELISRRNGRLPMGLRMGAREVRHHRIRTAAIVGAVAVVCTIPVGVLTRVVTEPDDRHELRSHPGLALVEANPPGVRYDVGVGAIAQPSTAGATSVAEVAEVADRVDARSVPLLHARWASEMGVEAPAHRPHPAGPVAEDEPWIDVWLLPELVADPDVPRREVSGQPRWAGPLVVATPELIDALGLSADAVADLARPGTVVQVEPEGRVQPSSPASGRLLLHDAFADPAEPSTEVTVVAHPVADLAGLHFGLLVSEANLPPGVVARAGGWTLLDPRRGNFDPDQVAWLDQHHPGSVGSITVPGGQPWRAQLVVLAVVAALVLVVARVVAGLTAVESDRDLAVMASLGAPRRYRQHLLGAQTGLVVGAAVAVAVPLGVAVGWANWLWSEPVRQGRLDVPWLLVAGLAVLPVLAATVVRLTSTSAPAAVSRRMT